MHSNDRATTTERALEIQRTLASSRNVTINVSAILSDLELVIQSTGLSEYPIEHVRHWTATDKDGRFKCTTDAAENGLNEC